MTRQSYKLLIFFATLLLVTPAAITFGQFRDIPPKYEEFGIVCLLGMPSVVEHLKADYDLTEDNAKTLKDLGRSRLKSMRLRRDLRIKTRKMNDEQFTKARTKLFKTIQQSNKENWAKAKELLNEKQIARLEELRIQRLGPAALMDPEVIEALTLSDEQLELAMTAKKDHDKALVRLRSELLTARKPLNLQPQSPESFEWNQEFAKALAEAKVTERDKFFNAVLDDQQRVRLDALTGEPFVFKLDFDFPAIKVDWQTDPLKQAKIKTQKAALAEARE